MVVLPTNFYTIMVSVLPVAPQLTVCFTKPQGYHESWTSGSKTPRARLIYEFLLDRIKLNGIHESEGLRNVQNFDPPKH